MPKKGASPQDEATAYILRAGAERVELPRELEGVRTKVVRSIPKPPEGTRDLSSPQALKAELAVPIALQMNAEDRRRLKELGKSFPRLHEARGQEALTALCGNHEAIGTVIPGIPLQALDTVGTWVSMPIAENGIDGLSGWIFTTFSNIAAQTLEVLGAYGGGNVAQLSVFDWSCVDGKPGTPACPSTTAWVKVKNQKDIPSEYKFNFWDGCKWQKAFALANKSRALVVEAQLPGQLRMKANLPLYVNEAKILNWQSMQWETFYARVFTGRDPEPPRPWGPTAFVEFISDSGCPDIPRLGFREVRNLPPGGSWELATPDNSTMRFDLPSNYRYCLFDPNHTWNVCLK